MMKEEMSHRVLKDLVFEFKKTQSQDVICKILERIDDLVLSVVVKWAAKHPQYSNIDYQDLYNSAIVGLYKGIDSAKESEPPVKIQARLIAYMKCEMLSACNKVAGKSSIIGAIDGLEDMVISGETVYHNLEMEFLADRYQKFIDDGVITQTEFDILYLRFALETKIKDIAMKFHHHTDWVRRKIEDSLNRIRVELRRRNLEDV